MPVILGILSFFGSGIKALFGFRQAQADVVKSAVEVLGNAVSSDAQKTQAIASILTAEATSGYWLAACWRPMFMVIFMIMILSYWFGYVPPHLMDNMPPQVSKLFDLIELGLGGYIPCRTLEKIVDKINVSQVLKALIGKNL